MFLLETCLASHIHCMFLGLVCFCRFSTYTKTKEVRRKRKMKEQKRENETKKRKVLSRQAKEVLNGNGKTDITQKPVFL